jgi:hypothetical protein
LSAARKRIETLQVELKAAELSFPAAVFRAITEELGEAESVRRTMPERRRHLLQIMHFCRALDTTLKQAAYGPSGGAKKTMGQCFQRLLDPPLSLITRGQYQTFMDDVRDPRNRFMHEAGAFPNSTYEASRHLGSIGACFSEILKLI